MNSEELDDILSRIERCELELQSARAHIKALEYGLHAAVVTHTKPQVIAELWDHLLVEIAESHADAPSLSPLFHASLKSALAGITKHVEEAVDRAKSR